MKTISIFLMVIVGFSSYGQMSKQEQKAWAAKAKEYKKNPAALKELTESVDGLKSENSALRSQVVTYEADLLQSRSEIEALNAQIDAMKSDTTEATEESAPRITARSDAGSGYTLPSSGLAFRVQIGAFRSPSMDEYIDNSTPNIKVEKTETEMQRITVGQFTDYKTADQFKKYLRSMGVKDAWIITYKDGQRVSIKDVLEEIPK